MKQGLSSTAFLICFAAGYTGCISPHEAIRSRVQETQDREAYGKYRNDLARSNIDREKAGQPPIPILNREEWAEGEAATRGAAGKK